MNPFSKTSQVGSQAFCKVSAKVLVRLEPELESRDEVIDGDVRLAKDGPQGSSCELVVDRDDGCSSLIVAELHMAAALTHLDEAEFLESSDRLAAGDHRQPGTQALSSSVTTMGGSTSVGRG